jgi:hypothetical protein
MNEVLSKKLLEDFPVLFRHRSESSMQQGFECGDGWFDLVYQLSRDIETAASECGMKPDDPSWPLCRQVKEKFGSLRFVVLAVEGWPDLSERISELKLHALNRSLNVCPECCQDVEAVSEGCAAILCPAHEPK